MRTQSPIVPRLLAAFAGLSLLVAACAGESPSPGASGQASASAGSGEPVELVWYCCLGTGEDAELQLPVEKRIVEEFNTSHPNIHLKLEVITYEEARDDLFNRLRGDNAPDIVGPVGVGGAEAFHGEWLDLAPYIAETGFDLGQYEPAAVELYASGGEGQVGIPFAVYPSVLFYRKSHFEEIGLNEPPHAYGEPYVWPDGRESEWNYDTIRELALLLTVDENGNDATMPGFNPAAIEQYGFEPYRDDPRGLGSSFGPGSVVSEDGGTVTIPPEWEAAWKFWYDAMWEDHIVLTGKEYDSDQWAGQVDFAFFTGRISMHTNFLWATYGVAEGGDDWDLAAVPSYNGETTSPLNADTFRILKASKHPDEAWEVLRYFLQDASADLLEIYAGMPAIPAEQDPFFQTYQEQFPNAVDWQVVRDSLQFADVPNWEGYMPKYNKLLDIMLTYADRWATTDGLDMETEIAALREELQSRLDE